MKASELKAKDSRPREQTILALIKMRIKHRSDSALKFVNRGIAKIVGTINLLSLILAFSLTPATADHLSIDGGGGTSSGGEFEVTGTIGPVQDGPIMTGDDIEATGQVVAMLVTVPAPDGTTLTISVTDASNVVLSWSSDDTNFVLEQTTDLASGKWTAVNLTPVDDGETFTVKVPMSGGSKFFRLRTP